jgi:hypothetical protein
MMGEKESLFLKSLSTISKANIHVLNASTHEQRADFSIYTSVEIPKEVISRLDEDGVLMYQTDLGEGCQEFRYLGHLKSKYSPLTADNRMDG